MLPDVEIEKLEKLLNVKFSILFGEFINDDSTYTPIHCPTKECSARKIQNRTCFAMPSERTIDKFFSDAQQAHKASPLTSVTAVIPLGVSLDPELLRNFVFLHEIPVGTPAWERVGYSLENNRTPVVYQVLHLCAKPLVAAVSVPQKHSDVHRIIMKFDGFVSRVPGVVMIDTGAEGNFMTKKYAEHIGLRIEPKEGAVGLPNNTSLPFIGVVTCKLRIGKLHEEVRCSVIDIAMQDYDLILGNPWLKKFPCNLDFGFLDSSDGMRLRKGAKVYHLVPRKEKPLAKEPLCQSPLLSAMQVKRYIRKGHHVFLGVLQHTVDPDEDDDSNPKNEDPFGSSPLRVQPLLKEYTDVFASPPAGLPMDRGITHAIPLEEGVKPPFRPMYRLSPSEFEEMKRQIQDYLDKGWIEPSSSPFGAPILFVSKKDGGLRMCIDYRALNKVTIKNRYPLPRIDDLFDKLQGAKYFTSLDLAQGYHQIRIPDEDVPKTAFRTPLGHFQFKVLSFGLTNAPATFQAAMNKVFQHLGKFCLVYLDDILIFSKTEEEHLDHLKQVLDLLRANKYYAKISKCHFMKDELEYLGHIVGRDGIRVDPRKVKAVNDWPTPTDIHKVRSFLGLANYFRKFMLGYATVVAPLTSLTRKDVPFHWTPKCQESFERVKVMLTTAPVLQLPDPTLPYEVICDASIVGVGAVLMQAGRPVAFESRKLTPAEVRYTTTEQELLAVVHALKTWRCYLEGAPAGVTVVTDHCPLTFFETQTALSRRQARWNEYLSRFTFTWEYRPGRINVADPLSRHPLDTTLDEGNPRLNLLFALTAQSVVNPLECSLGAISTVQAPKDPQVFSGHLHRIRMGYTIDPWFANPHNLQRYKIVQASDLYWRGDRVVVPNASNLRKELLHEFHNIPLAGHVGPKKTGQALAHYYWWPHWGEDVRAHCEKCVACQMNKPVTLKQPGLLQPLNMPYGVWRSCSMDFIVRLPMTPRGYDAILVVVDYFSKMGHFIPTRTDATAEDTARLFWDNIIRFHGLPLNIVSDRDARFTSQFWQRLFDLHGTRVRLSTAFHPQTDGQTERLNRTLEQMLRMYVDPCLDDWDEWLTPVEFAYNNAVHDSTGCKPFVMVYGRHPVVPASLVKCGDREDQVPSVKAFVHRMETLRASAKTFLLGAKSRQKAYADTKRRELDFAPGDMVLLDTRNLRLHTTRARKLLPRRIGPFRITERIGKVAYRLELPLTLKVHDVFHVSLLCKFKGDLASVRQPLAMLAEDDHLTVHRIVQHREKTRGNTVTKEYLVIWSGCGPEYTSWEPESYLPPEPVLAYHATLAEQQLKRASGGPPRVQPLRRSSRLA